MSEQVGKQSTNKAPNEPRSSGSVGGGINGPWRRQNLRQRGGKGKRLNKPSPTKPSFKGRCKDLEGFIFDIGPQQATKYTKTKTEIIHYAGRKYGADVRRAIDSMECVRNELMTNIPSLPPTGDDKDKTKAQTNEMEAFINKEMARQYIIKVLQYDEDMKIMYSIVHGQCTDAMLQKISTHAEYQNIQLKADAIGLLKIIKKICYKYEAHQFPPLAAVRSLMALLNTKQGDLMTDIEWHEHFENLVTAAVACGADFELPGVQNYVLEQDYQGRSLHSLSDWERVSLGKRTTDLTLSTIYIENSNHGRYEDVQTILMRIRTRTTNF